VAFLDEQLKKGTSDHRNPHMRRHSSLSRRKTGSYTGARLSQAERTHNPQSLPLPFIPDLISQVQDTHIFTKFDVCWGYNNIRIKAGTKKKGLLKQNMACLNH